MLVDKLLDNKVSECFNFLWSYRFLVWPFIKNRSRHLLDMLWQTAFPEKSLRQGEFLTKIKE